MKTINSIFFFLSLLYVHSFAAKQPYIVYMGAHSHPSDATEEHFNRATAYHHQFLASYLGSEEEAKNAIFYSYNKHINGFAAILDEHQAAKIAENPKVISVFPDRPKKLHTTYSWDFMSLENNGHIRHTSLWSKASFGEDTIIANLDTGVWPESRSFSDHGLGPVPSKWKGTCKGSGIRCNRKLIGARNFNKAYIADNGKIDPSINNARDYEGHGSHTLSTAGGSFVPGANIFGIANGTAKGGSPKARVAVYKVCWPPLEKGECYEADALAGFDMAIHDGVDVLSISLGGFPSHYSRDGMAIGAFHAVQNGIVVVCSAGNFGPFEGFVSNISPWILTVGASTMDREFRTFVQLGNGQRLKGASLSPSLPDERLYPLVNAAHAKLANASVDDAILCQPGTLDHNKVKGKILVCLIGIDITRIEQGIQAKLAGAVGLILCNAKEYGNYIVADTHVLPAANLNYEDGVIVFAYLNSTDPNEAYGFITHPTAELNVKPAPMVADFSSRGPNAITPGILKPDITAPGVNIIAAYSGALSPTEDPSDHRKVPFMFMSGTSMSCPHIAGVAGLLKTLHPDWSPAAIRSAIMTTARTRDNTFNPIKHSAHHKATPFDYGAGHVRPNQAMDPGLVYDLNTGDYLDFLCASGYDKTMITAFYNGTHKCPEPGSPRASLVNFNYPSITVPNLSGSVTLTRRVKNVGPPAIYASRVHPLKGVSVTVDPATLKFDKVGEEKSFTVTLKANHLLTTNYTFGGLAWCDGYHVVRSPIVVAGVTS